MGGAAKVALMGDRILLRPFEDSDADSLLDMHLRNGEFFQKYAPTYADDFYTLAAKQRYISSAREHREGDKAYSFGIFLKDSGKLIGDVSLSHISRGSLQKCLIGYSVDQQQNGKGYATEAVSLAVEFAFRELGLHRVEAGVMISNAGSMRVLEKVGFHREGIEQKGVKINGRWEDHQILAIISSNG